MDNHTHSLGGSCHSAAGGTPGGSDASTPITKCFNVNQHLHQYCPRATTACTKQNIEGHWALGGLTPPSQALSWPYLRRAHAQRSGQLDTSTAAILTSDEKLAITKHFFVTCPWTCKNRPGEVTFYAWRRELELLWNSRNGVKRNPIRNKCAAVRIKDSLDC